MIRAGASKQPKLRAPMANLQSGQLLGTYRIVRLLGEGGMGAVYEAKQEPLGRRVALKVLHAEFAEDADATTRFFNEAKILSRLEHLSIVQVSDFGQTPEGITYLVMEFLRGESLASKLDKLTARGENLSVIAGLQLAWQVADVLAVAHAQGIVHRDLKPDNLMLVEDALAPGGLRVKILDFGIAKLTDPKQRGLTKTDTQTVMGTPMYMSPEQCAGAGGVDDRTDVYSLGCVLYQALAGRPPFVAEGAGQLIGMHLFQHPPALSSVASRVPTTVAELVHRLLTKEKTKRPSMSEVADDVGKLLSKLSGAGPVVRSRTSAGQDETQVHVRPSGGAASTLGRALGERTAWTSPRVRNLLLGGFSLAIFGAAIFLLFRLRQTDSPVVLSPLPANPPAATVAALPIPSSPTARTIHWRVDTEPSNAAVFDSSGVELGRTPWIHEQQAASGEFRLAVHHEGYVDTTISLDLSSDAVRRVILNRKPSSFPKKIPAKGVSNALGTHPATSSGKKPGKISYED